MKTVRKPSTKKAPAKTKKAKKASSKKITSGNSILDSAIKLALKTKPK